MAGRPGKRGGAVNIEANLTAPAAKSEEIGSVVQTNNTIVPAIEPEIQIYDVYTVGYNPKHAAQPFIHQLSILPINGKAIHVQANFDDGALINAMSATKFNNIKHDLGSYKPSSRWLRMANGAIVGAIAVWEGELEIGGIKAQGSFEVFDSGDSWEFLFGKPLLAAFNSIHEYKTDTVTVESRGITAILKNQINNMKSNDETHVEEGEQSHPSDNEEAPQPKEVSMAVRMNKEHMADFVHTGNTKDSETTQVYVTTGELNNNTSELTEIELDALKNDDNVFTRFTNPRKKERVEEILKQATVGPDLNNEQPGRSLVY